MDEKRKKEEEMLFVQGNYSSLQQEVESMRAIMEKLRNKYKSAESEIADLTRPTQMIIKFVAQNIGERQANVHLVGQTNKQGHFTKNYDI